MFRQYSNLCPATARTEPPAGGELAVGNRAAAEESLLKLFNVGAKSNLEVAFKPKSCLHRLDDFFSY